MDPTRLARLVADHPDPHTGRTLGEDGAVRGVGVDGDRVAIEIRLGYPAAGWVPALEAGLRERLAAEPGIGQVVVSIDARSHYKGDRENVNQAKAQSDDGMRGDLRAAPRSAATPYGEVRDRLRVPGARRPRQRSFVSAASRAKR